MIMGNRGEGDREAIAASMEAAEPKEQREGKLSSQYVYEAVGVPNDQKVVEAIDNWANIWGDVIHPTMKDEGLYDDTDPAHIAAMEKMNVATDALKEALPSVKIMIGLITFEGGHVQLSP